MKKIVLTFSLLTLFTVVYSQGLTSLVVQVIDSRSNSPIEDAVFVIEETGFQKGISNKEGKVFFEGSVPIGRLHYRVTRKDYELYEGYFNTTITSENTLIVSLVQERKKTRDNILLTGEVTNNDGLEVINAQVEIRIANITERTNTDISGNYLVEVDMTKLLYEADQIIVEVKQNNCRTTEIIELSDNNYFTKNIVLSCKSVLKNDPSDSSSGSSTENENLKDSWLGYWHTSIHEHPGEVILEIKKDLSGRLVGEYSLGQDRNGYVIYYEVSSGFLKGFWYVASNYGRVENCGEAYYELNKNKDSFRGTFQILNLDDDNRYIWNGRRN